MLPQLRCKDGIIMRGVIPTFYCQEGVSDGRYYLFCAGFSNFLYLCVCVGVQLITVETGTGPVLYDSPRIADDDRRER